MGLLDFVKGTRQSQQTSSAPQAAPVAQVYPQQGVQQPVSYQQASIPPMAPTDSRVDNFPMQQNNQNLDPMYANPAQMQMDQSFAAQDSQMQNNFQQAPDSSLQQTVEPTITPELAQPTSYGDMSIPSNTDLGLTNTDSAMQPSVQDIPVVVPTMEPSGPEITTNFQNQDTNVDSTDLQLQSVDAVVAEQDSMSNTIDETQTNLPTAQQVNAFSPQIPSQIMSGDYSNISVPEISLDQAMQTVQPEVLVDAASDSINPNMEIQVPDIQNVVPTMPEVNTNPAQDLKPLAESQNTIESKENVPTTTSSMDFKLSLLGYTTDGLDTVSSYLKTGVSLVLDESNFPQDLQSSGIDKKKIEILKLLPFVGTVSSNTNQSIKEEYSTILYSNIFEWMRHFLKESRAFVFYSFNNPVYISIASLIMSTHTIYGANAKPIVFVGNAVEMAKVLAEKFNLTNSDRVMFLENTDASDVVSKIAQIIESSASIKIPRIVDRRVNGDERDNTLY